MFESYTERRSRDRLKYGALVVLVIALSLTFIQLTCRNAADMEALISSSPTLIDHDRFCQKIPRPANFELRFRTVGGNSFTRSISYWYSSALPFLDVADFYRQRMENDGWTTISFYKEDMTAVGKHISFEKGNYRISVETVGDGSSKYALSCSELNH